MGCFLQFVIFSLISTVFGVVEISFMEGSPRLNNSLYCDYYFACHAEGETLQWKVNNTNISGYSMQSIIGTVINGSISSCNYITTLLSVKTLPSGISVFDSVLIVSCQNGTSFGVVCTNGFISSEAGNPEKTQNTMAVNNFTSIYLDHVVNKNLVSANSYTCTNIFMCGVNNDFMTWQLQESDLFTFSIHDTIGMKRQTVQGGTVEQQAILIDNAPYSLVVALFILGSATENVTCKYNQVTADLSSVPCPTVLGTTEPETMGTTESITTGSMESESSTVEISSTLASGGDNRVHIIVGLSVSFGVLLVAVIAVIASFIVVFSILYNRNMESKFGTPLRDNNFSGIKRSKERMNDIEYKTFFNGVHYIFLTRNKNAFNAATTILTAPDIENTTNEQLTCIDEGVYIGMIGDHPVCLVNEAKNHQKAKDHFVEKIENVIIQYFPNAKYLVFVGKCFGINPKNVKLADILISKCIRYATVTNEYQIKPELTPPEIRSKFCFFPEKVEGLKVTKNRSAEHLVAKIASGVNILGDTDFRNFALSGSDGIYGCEETSGELVSHFKNGIYMGNNTTKHIQVITIGAVTGYVDGDSVNEYDEWQFMAFQAAFHYVSSKMINPHLPGNISYEVKKPKPKPERGNTSYSTEHVNYVILTIGPDEFDAATTYISAPTLEKDILEIVPDVYTGMIGSHPVGLLFLRHPEHYYVDIKKAIETHFPHAEYLIHVGGCSGIDPNKTKLGDVLISDEIYNINYDGESCDFKIIKMTPEIRNMFCNSSNVNGLQLPGNRTTKYFEVRMATGTGADIENNKKMREIAVETENNYGYDEVGGELYQLQEKMKSTEREIHFILINGICCYKYNRNCDEWDFVASQAAIHYVASKMKMH